jgi:hypothetical protein
LRCKIDLKKFSFDKIKSLGKNRSFFPKKTILRYFVSVLFVSIMSFSKRKDELLKNSYQYIFTFIEEEKSLFSAPQSAFSFPPRFDRHMIGEIGYDQ